MLQSNVVAQANDKLLFSRIDNSKSYAVHIYTDDKQLDITTMIESCHLLTWLEKYQATVENVEREKAIGAYTYAFNNIWAVKSEFPLEETTEYFSVSFRFGDATIAWYIPK